MRSLVPLSLLCYLFLAASSPFAASQFVEIKQPLANIYEFLDPKSNIIVQAKKGDHYELVYAGTSWYQVKVQEKVGWLERRAGEVVSSATSVPIGSLVLLVVILLGTFGIVFVFVQKQRTAEL
jgi:hypothetical protein